MTDLGASEPVEPLTGDNDPLRGLRDAARGIDHLIRWNTPPDDAEPCCDPGSWQEPPYICQRHATVWILEEVKRVVSDAE